MGLNENVRYGNSLGKVYALTGVAIGRDSGRLLIGGGAVGAGCGNAGIGVSADVVPGPAVKTVLLNSR